MDPAPVAAQDDVKYRVCSETHHKKQPAKVVGGLLMNEKAKVLFCRVLEASIYRLYRLASG